MPEDESISTVNVYTRIPAPLARELRRKCADLDKRQPEAIADAITAWLSASITKSGDAGDTNPDSSVRNITDNREVPKNKCVSSLGQNTDAVISCLQKHWGDEDFRACILGTLRTWDVGDSDIKDSLTRNCETFARSSDMVEALREIQVQPGQLSPEYEERIAALLSVARRSLPKAPNSKGPNRRGARGGT